MAKPSSIPRKNFRSNYSQNPPSSPLRAHTSTLPPQDLVTSSKRMRDKDRRESLAEEIEQVDDDDDDFNPFTSHKSNKFSASSALADQRPLNSYPQAESSLWLFDEDGRADSTNIMQGVVAPWGMATSDGEDDALVASGSNKKPSTTMKDSATATIASPKIRILSPVNDLASSLLSPTHKLSRQSVLPNNVRKPLSSCGIPPFNLSANPIPSKSSNGYKTHHTAKRKSTTSNAQETIQEDRLPSTSELQATRSHSVQPTEVSVKPLPPSAIKKPREASVDAPKSIKKTRFIDLDENFNQYPSSSSVPLQPIADSSTSSTVDVDHIHALPWKQDKTCVSSSERTRLVFKEPAANSPPIPTTANHPPTASLPSAPFPTSEPTKSPPPIEIISLLTSSPVQPMHSPLSPDRTLASRLQPSQCKNKSTRALSVESVTDQPTIQNSNQRIKAQNAPLSSFKRLSRANSTDSKVFQTIKAAPTLMRASSISNSDFLRPSRIIRNLASLTGATEDDIPNLHVAKKIFGNPSKNISEPSGEIVKAQTNATANVVAPSEGNKMADEHDCCLRPADPPEKLESFIRQKETNNLEEKENSTPSEIIRIQEVKPIDTLQDDSQNPEAQGQQSSSAPPRKSESFKRQRISNHHEENGSLSENEGSQEMKSLDTLQDGSLNSKVQGQQPTAAPLPKSQSSKRQKGANYSEDNASLSENEGIQEMKSVGTSQYSSQKSKKPTNRIHVSEKVGPRLSALLELPTPNSTVEAINSGDIEGIAMSSNLSMICQNDGVPRFSTPHTNGLIGLPLPPDTNQLPTTRPRSGRKSSVRLSPLKPSQMSMSVDVLTTQVSDAARRKRPSTFNDDQTAPSISKRPRVPSTSTVEHPRVRNNLSQAHHPPSRSSSFPHKPIASQSRTRVNSQTVRKASSSKVVAGASVPAQKPESKKSSTDSQTSSKVVAEANVTTQKPESQKSSDNLGNPTTYPNSRPTDSNNPSFQNPEAPLPEVRSQSPKFQEVVDLTMSPHVKATDIPAVGRFSICLGVPSAPTSDFADQGPSEHHKAQPILSPDHESAQLIPTLDAQRTQSVNLHSSGDRDNWQSTSACPASCSEVPSKNTFPSRGTGPASRSVAPLKDTLPSRSTGPTSNPEGPLLTLPKEFAFTMRSTMPAKPRIKDARQQSERDHPPKQTLRSSQKVSVPEPLKSKQLVRLRSNDGENERASKRPRHSRSIVPSPSRPKVGPSRPSIANRVRNTIKCLNSLSKNVTTASTVKRTTKTSQPFTGSASSQVSRNPPPAASTSTRFVSSTSQPRIARQNNENVPPTTKKAPVKSQNVTITTKITPVPSNSGPSDDVLTVGSSKGTSAARRLLMEEIRQRSKFHKPQSDVPVSAALPIEEEKKGANKPLVKISENPSRPAPRGGTTSRVLSGASSSRTTSVNLTHEVKIKNQNDKNSCASSTGFQNRLNKWREVEAQQQTLNSSTNSNKLPEWQDVSLVHHVLPVKDHSKPKKPPMRFGLATERRILERENWEQIKANKEKIEAEIKAQEEMKARELEREEFIKMRKECVVKANPVPDYLKKHRCQSHM